MKKEPQLVLELDGSFEQGFNVRLEIREKIYARPKTIVKGQLPSNLALLDIYCQWQNKYWELGGYFRALKDTNPNQLTRGSDQRKAIYACQETARLVEENLNNWLNSSEGFDPIKKAILRTENNFSLWLQTDDVSLQRLPWEKWDLLQEAQAEVAVIVVSEYDISERQHNPNQQIRILAILGGATDLSFLEEDRKILDKIAGKAGAKIVWKEAPKPEEFNQLLRESNWDIFFFSGHSASTGDGKRCEIQLTENDKLEIPDFGFALREATEKGLKLAIFNSCDGIGLAHQLHQLAKKTRMALPYLIFMREKLPDPVSPKFLQYFLESFTDNKSIYHSVHEAQKILHDDWERYYPCASWLPVVCPNPTEDPPTWDSLSLAFQKQQEILQKQQKKRLLRLALTVSLAVGALVVGLRELGALEGLELNAYDQMMRLKAKDKPDERFLIVTIDKEDKKYQDKQGWKRPKILGTNNKRSLAGEALAKLLSKLKAGKPSVIALDILRPISASEDYSLLAEQLKNTPNFIAICKFNNSPKNDGFPPPPELPEKQVGFSNVTGDVAISKIPKIRRYLYQAKLDKTSPCLPPSSLVSNSSISCNFNEYVPSFGLLIAKQYLESQNKDFDCEKLNQGILEVNISDTSLGDWLQSTTGPYKTQQETIQAGRQVMLNYRRMADNGDDAITKIAPRKSLREVLDSSFNLDSVRGKIILIGVTQPKIDDFLTAFSRKEAEVVPGVYLHAHAISQILDTMLGERVSIRFWTPLQETFWIFGWCVIGGVLAWRFLKFKYIIIANVIILVTLSGICLILFNWGGLWVPLIPPALGIVVTVIIYQLSVGLTRVNSTKDTR